MTTKYFINIYYEKTLNNAIVPKSIELIDEYNNEFKFDKLNNRTVQEIAARFTIANDIEIWGNYTLESYVIISPIVNAIKDYLLEGHTVVVNDVKQLMSFKGLKNVPDNLGKFVCSEQARYAERVKQTYNYLMNQ